MQKKINLNNYYYENFFGFIKYVFDFYIDF